MNEAEAKTKWCPEARVYNSVGSINRHSGEGLPINSMCLGHGCMMFVLDKEAYDEARYAYEEGKIFGDSPNVISLLTGTPPDAAPKTERPKQPDIRDFYKCGKVFPDIV